MGKQKAKAAKANKAKQKLAGTPEGRLVLQARQREQHAAECCSEDLLRFPCRDARGAAVRSQRVGNLDPEALRWAFQLVKTNLQDLYVQSQWGWNDKRKKRELKEADTVFFFVDIEGEDEPGAFASVQFVMEYGFPVLYCYELHVTPAHQRQGLGGHLINVLKEVARVCELSKVMLTVFNKNPMGMSFYKKHGFATDECDDEHVDYTIMSVATPGSPA